MKQNKSAKFGILFTLLIAIIFFAMGFMLADMVKMARSAYYISSGDMDKCLAGWNQTLNIAKECTNKLGICINQLENSGGLE